MVPRGPKLQQNGYSTLHQTTDEEEVPRGPKLNKMDTVRLVKTTTDKKVVPRGPKVNKIVCHFFLQFEFRRVHFFKRFVPFDQVIFKIEKKFHSIYIYIYGLFKSVFKKKV